MTQGPLFGNVFPEAFPVDRRVAQPIHRERVRVREDRDRGVVGRRRLPRSSPRPKASAQSGALFPKAPHDPPATPTSTSRSGASARVDLCVDLHRAGGGRRVEVAVCAAYGVSQTLSSCGGWVLVGLVLV